MPFLAIETSADRLSLAVNIDREIVSREWQLGQKHAELTLPSLQSFLAEIQLTMADIDGIAYAEGPGSFTGLRIGCGITQGLAFACQIPTMGISTLESLAEASGAIRVIACIDARMNQVYYAAFERVNGAWLSQIEALVCNPEDVPLPAGNDWVGVGNGFAAYADALTQRLSGCLQQVKADLYPQASAFLSLALPRFAAGQGAPAHEAQLVYLRDKVALKTHERVQK